MAAIEKAELVGYVEKNIGRFHDARLASLTSLKLRDVLKKKNPYLFKAKNILTAPDLVKAVLDAHLSSQEETMFGDFLEELAVYICARAFNGRKSAAVGIDLELDRNGVRYVVSIKSGPHWGNSRQVNKMIEDFKTAKIILRANNPDLNVTAINGCCYGRDSKPDKGHYIKLCGQRFWEFISGDENLYVEIIEPLGHKAKEKNEEFLTSYAQIINRFTLEFMNEFCVDGRIQWDMLVKFNSSKERTKKRKASETGNPAT